MTGLQWVIAFLHSRNRRIGNTDNAGENSVTDLKLFGCAND